MDSIHKSAIILSASSDIGYALSQRWIQNGWSVYGTYRVRSELCSDLESSGAQLIHCDLLNVDSIREASSNLADICPEWDVLVLCSGMLEPIGAFEENDIDQWEDSFRVNFTSQVRFIHSLLPYRRLGNDSIPSVLLFAGHGTNNAPINMSSYIVSKIALIKMCELMDSEMRDTRFIIIGPGPVNTKIHEATYSAGSKGEANYLKTLDRDKKNHWVSMDEVLDCCDWAIDSPREVVSGRNISLVFDYWGEKELDTELLNDPDMYKLRRSGNDRLVKPNRW